MPGTDAGHWLHRLSAAEWIAAAETELRQCDEALSRRGYRPGVTHARRAAGMALNAVLVGRPNDAWGRSYMEHVVAVAADPGVPEAVRRAAQSLRETRPLPPDVIAIGRPDKHALEDATAIVEWARREVGEA